jgi:predicted dehydrogenase
LRIGVVGLGRGRKFAEIFAARPDCRVVAVCDPSERALAAVPGPAAHTDYEEFLGEDLDVVAVVSPGPLHAEQSVRALESGAHVLCETPPVYSLEEARAVLRAVRQSGRSYMLAEDYVWHGWVGHLAEQVRAGMFGEIVYAEGDYTHDCRDIMLATDDGFVPYRRRAAHPGARRTWRATDLPPLFYCSHTLGPLLHLMADRVVSATALSTGCRTAPDLGAPDLEAALLGTAKGAVIRLTNGFSLAHPMGLHYSLAGTRGSMKRDRAGETRFAWYSEEAGSAGTGWQRAPREWEKRADGRDHLEVMIEDFVGSVLRGEPPPIDAHRSLDYVLPGIVAHRSAERGGEPLEVPDPRELLADVESLE